MGEIKRLINRKVIYIIIISLILCVLCYILKSAGTDGVREYLADNNIYNGAINSLSQKDIQTADKYIENLKENGKKERRESLSKGQEAWSKQRPPVIFKTQFLLSGIVTESQLGS